MDNIDLKEISAVETLVGTLKNVTDETNDASQVIIHL